MNNNHDFLKRISVLLGLSVIFSTILIGAFEAQAEEYEVVIPRGSYSPQCVKADTCFIPSSLSIPENSTVEWKNKDHAPHNVVSGNGQSDSFGLFSSRVLNYGDEFYVDFSSLGQGVYPYYCSIHPWMKGEIIIGDVKISDQPSQPEPLDDSKDESMTVDMDSKQKHEKKMKHESSVLSSERNLENYTLRLDWIHEFPVTGQVNGFELIVTDSSKAGMMMSGGGCGGGSHGNDSGSHDDKGMKGKMSKHGESEDHSSHDEKGMKGMGCGGGSHGDETSDHSSHDDKGMKGKMSKHGESEDHSSHDDKGMKGMSGGMGGHEGGCPHFKMVKQSMPKVAALEAGVENLEDSLNLEIIVLGKSYPISLEEDNEFKGRYYVLFIPTVATQYDVHVSGVIDANTIDFHFSPPKVIDKSLIQQIP